MSEREVVNDVIGLTAAIVTAYVGHNKVAVDDISDMIASVHASLVDLGTPEQAEAIKQQLPAVPIKKSVHPDYLVCLEDGRRLKMMKRYLLTQYGMTPDAYRQKWQLPADYPMVAPNYALRRSALAKEIGLGQARTTNLAGKSSSR